MTQRKNAPSVRRHIMLYEDDWMLLDQLYGWDSKRKMGPGAAVCAIVHNKCKSLRASIIAKLDAQGPGPSSGIAKMVLDQQTRESEQEDGDAGTQV